MTRLLDDPGARRVMDLVRAGAILQVVLFHVLYGLLRFSPDGAAQGIIARMPWWLDFGWQAYGVDLLFLVSTFLLASGLWHEQKVAGRIDTRQYIVRRLSRILPLYWLAVLAYGIAAGDGVQTMIVSAAFLGFVVGDANVVPVGWTMEAMMIVYLALPFTVAALARSRFPLHWVAAAFLLSGLVRAGYIWWADEEMARMMPRMIAEKTGTEAGFELYFRLWFRLPPFLAGLWLAIWLARHPLPRRGGPVLVALGLALCWVSAAIPVHDTDSWVYGLFGETAWRVYWAFAIPVFAVGAGLLLVAALAGGTGGTPKAWHRLFAPVSESIFGIYLFHMVFMLLAAIVVFRSTDRAALVEAGPGAALAVWAVTALLSLAACLPLTRFVERPAQTWLRRRLSRG